MTRRRDAALTLLVLLPALAGVVLRGGRPSVPALLAGGLGCLLAEAVALRYRRVVRRYWADRRVRATAVALGTLAVVGAVVTAPVLLDAAVGGLITYLLLLLVVEGRAAGEGS